MGGSYGVFAGFSVASAGRIVVTGHHNRITRNYFFDQNVGDQGIIVTEGDGIHDNRVDHNHFQRFTGAAWRSDGWSNDGATDNQGTRVDHNYFQSHTVGPVNESVVLMLGDAYTDAKLLYDHNLFDDVLNGERNQSELISIKTSGTTLRNNTVINSPNTELTLRQSNRSILEGNWLEGGAGIRTYGDNHVIRNNRVIGDQILIAAGSGTMDTRRSGCQKSDTSPVLADCTPVHANARHTLVENNIGTIVVGAHHTTHTSGQVEDTTLRNNEKAATLVAGFHVRTTESGVGNETNTARKLTPSDVGRNAPDPSCQ